MAEEMQKKASIDDKQVKTSDFYLSVYAQMRNGKNPSQIASYFNVKLQNIKYYTDFFIKKGFVRKIGYGTWEITPKGEDFNLVSQEVKTRTKRKSSGTSATRPLTNLHALQINFPILSGKIYDKDWQIKEKLNNWLPKYKGLHVFGGLTFKNNNNKSVSVFIKSKNISSLEEVDKLAFSVRDYVGQYFKNQGIELDLYNCKVSNINLATEDRDAETMQRKGDKFELNLKKQSEKIFEKDDIKAKAWIDGSPFKFSAETNDKEWKREYLSMPFRIRDSFYLSAQIMEHQAMFAENMKSHVEAIQELKRLAENINERFKA